MNLLFPSFGELNIWTFERILCYANKSIEFQGYDHVNAFMSSAIKEPTVKYEYLYVILNEKSQVKSRPLHINKCSLEICMSGKVYKEVDIKRPHHDSNTTRKYGQNCLQSGVAGNADC